MKCQPGYSGYRVSGRGVNSVKSGRIRRDSRFEVILSLVIVAIRHIVDAELQFRNAIDLFGDPEVEYRRTGRNDGWVVSIQAVMIDSAHPEGAAPSFPSRHGEARISDEVRRTIHIYPMIAASVERIGNFR